jgi:hypothetical protein
MPSCEYCGRKVGADDYVGDELARIYICGKRECELQYTDSLKRFLEQRTIKRGGGMIDQQEFFDGIRRLENKMDEIIAAINKVTPVRAVPENAVRGEPLQSTDRPSWVELTVKRDVDAAIDLYFDKPKKMVKMVPQPQWIPVSERKPVKNHNVLLRGETEYVPQLHFEGFLCSDGIRWADWTGEIDDDINVTHWMEIPE